MDIRVRAKDHPQANGRQPKHGEHNWTLKIPLESGDTLYVSFGKETHTFLRQFVHQEMRDDEMGLPSGVSTPLIDGR